MITDNPRQPAELALRSWQDWRNLETPARMRLLDAPSFRLANRLMDRGDMVIEVAGSSALPRPHKLGDCHAFLVDVSTPGIRPTVSQTLAQAVARGAGLVAVNNATAAFQDDPLWRDLIGATASQPHSEGPTPLAVLDNQHPTTFNLGTVWEVTDRFAGAAGLLPDACLLIRTATAPPGPHKGQPVAWSRQFGQGRVFVLTLGHEPAVRDRPEFITVVHDAIRWAGRQVEERHNQLTLSDRKAGFILLFDGQHPGELQGDPRHWSVCNHQLVGRLGGAGGESRLASSVLASLSDLRFSFMPVKGQTSLLIGRGNGATATVIATLPLDHDLPPEIAGTLWPDGWHLARIHVADRTVRLWINGIPVESFAVDPKDLAGPISISWSLAGEPGSELRLRDVKYRPRSPR